MGALDYEVCDVIIEEWEKSMQDFLTEWRNSVELYKAISNRVALGKGKHHCRRLCGRFTHVTHTVIPLSIICVRWWLPISSRENKRVTAPFLLSILILWGIYAVLDMERQSPDDILSAKDPSLRRRWQMRCSYEYPLHYQLIFLAQSHPKATTSFSLPGAHQHLAFRRWPSIQRNGSPK